MLLPLHLIALTVTGLLSLALFICALYSLFYVSREIRYRQSNSRNPLNRDISYKARKSIWSDAAITVPVMLSLLLVVFTFWGRHIVQYAFPVGQNEPGAERSGVVQHVKGNGGEDIRVETYGPEGAPVLLFTHGWSMDSTEWIYAKRDLAGRFRLIFWDLPGLGQSAQPKDRDFGLETLARNLRSVLTVANGKPAVLVGHSIGGMINLTACRLFPDLMGREVAGIVQVDTTYTNPVKTTKNSEMSQALQKPVAEPILYGMIALSPLVRAMNWLSYQNGTSYLMNAKSAFAGAETRGQIDLVSRLQAEASPAVVARGTLAMFHWDASAVLPQITVPVLVLVGQQDTTTLPSASEHMRQTIPKASLVMVSPSAHYSLLEQNKRIDAEIEQFAGGVSQGVVAARN